MPNRLSDPLRHPVRRGVYEYLRTVGGERLCDLSRRFGASRNTMEYHLFLLRRHRLVTQEGQFWRLPSRSVAPEDVARHGTKSLVLGAIRARAGAGSAGEAGGGQPIGLTDLGRALGLHVSHVAFHVRALERIGLVTTRRLGRRRVVSVSPQPPRAAAASLGGAARPLSLADGDNANERLRNPGERPAAVVP